MLEIMYQYQIWVSQKTIHATIMILSADSEPVIWKYLGFMPWSRGASWTTTLSSSNRSNKHMMKRVTQNNNVIKSWRVL